ncbi:hypothetical protein OA39_03734 [Vibrio campbellii]|nr:hypothetical protein OA39_03734 [Vibrio campbellii]
MRRNETQYVLRLNNYAKLYIDIGRNLIFSIYMLLVILCATNGRISNNRQMDLGE